jgi:hypothetical protein
MLGNAGFATLVKVIYPGEPAKTRSLLLGRTVPRPRRLRPDYSSRGALDLIENQIQLDSWMLGY